MKLLDLKDATPDHFDLAREKARRDPASLTEADLAVLEMYGGKRWRENKFFGAQPAPAASASDATEIAQLRADVAQINEDMRKAYDCIVALVDTVAKLKTFATQTNERNKERNRRLDALEARPVVKYAGVWEPGTTYSPGDIVTFSGSGWVCRSAHVAVGMQPQHDAFTLFVKKGKDGKDGR